MTKPELVALSGVSFSYQGEAVLEDISLVVHQGDFIGIIGPNGSGKTTLLKIMLGLLKASHGSVQLFGHDVAHFRDRFRLGYVPQKNAQADLQFPVTVQEVVAQGRYASAGLFRQLKAHDFAAIENALQMVGMIEAKDRLVRELSGGQQQRVFIARALASEPQLLILDEPTVGVDVESQEEFYALLSQLRREKNLTLIMVSHDVDVVVNEVTKLICINKKLVYHGTPERFIKGDYLEKLYGKGRSLILHGH